MTLFAELLSVSIAVAHALCNAAVGLRSLRWFALRLLPLSLWPIERRNLPRDIASAIAMLAADRLQQQKPKHMFFKETARAGAICFVSATSPAMEFLKDPAPRGLVSKNHKIPPDRTILTPHYDAKLRIKGQSLSSPLVLPDRRTCKAAFRHVKVRRRCYCESAMKSE